MEDLKPYMVEFEENGVIKLKIYPSNCAVGDEDHWLIIIITYNECTFSANNRIWRVWTRVRDIFLWSQGCGQSIITSEFLFPFGRLNLASFSSEKRQKAVEKCGLLTIEVVEIFEYRKNNNGYWDRAKLHHQVVGKALSIREGLYPRYSLLFLFDNATKHSVYVKDILRVKNINKAIGSKQPQLHNEWYNLNEE